MEQRHTVITATRRQLGAFAEQISDWRTMRYMEAGFYSRAEVAAHRRRGVAIESNRGDDFEVVAFGDTGSILATLSLRRPIGSAGWTTTEATRPTYGLERVHGTAFLDALPAVAMDRCWEAGRFLRDRNVDSSRAVVSVTVAAAELVAGLAANGQAARLIGEAEPTVAIRHVTAFGLPLITGTHVSSASVDGLLQPRYRGRTIVPFAVDLTAITAAHCAAWRRLSDRSHLLEEAASVA